MVIVNKILNVLIFLLAIAACIAALLLNERRQELSGRANHLQYVVEQVGGRINGDAENNTATDLDGTKYANKEKLDWKAYHNARHRDAAGNVTFDAYETPINQLFEDVSKVVDLKVSMAAKFYIFAEAIKYEEVREDATQESKDNYLAGLNSISGFDANAQNALTKIGTITGRAKLLGEYLEKVTDKLNKKQDLANFDIFTDSDVQTASHEENSELLDNLRQIETETSNLMARKDILAGGYAKLIEAFNEDPEKNMARYFEPSMNPADLTSEDTEDINNGINTLFKDLKQVNILLHERVIALKDLEESRHEVAKNKITIAELNADNDDLKNKNGILTARNLGLTKRIQALEEAAGKRFAEMPRNLVAKVVQVNERFDFVVLNKGLVDKVAQNGELLIHSNNKFVCKVKVTKVDKNTCVCDILPVTRPTYPATHPKAGQYVSPQVGDEAVVPGI